MMDQGLRQKGLRAASSKYRPGHVSEKIFTLLQSFGSIPKWSKSEYLANTYLGMY